MLTQESLATLMTSMMAQTGSLGQPLLIPLSMPGAIGGQGGLAVLTLPTTNVATLPGFTAANPAGSLLKLPFAGFQGKTMYIFNMSAFVLTRLQLKNSTTNADIIIFTSFFY